MSGVQLQNICKQFGNVSVIKDVSLDIRTGEFCVFVGPSGCGKSTLLRMIAGLESVSSGQLAIEGDDVTEREPSARGVAMVFQSYALYPHMTVRENMGFGLKMTGVPADEIARKVQRASEILRLDALLDRKPKALSGGQRQRVAIGRAIVREPKVFLFDEPLSNLDAELRVQMRVELAALHRQIGATMIYVTHDQVEAMTLADKMVVLRDGRVEQVGAPLELYQNPANRFVAGFVGSPAMNFISAQPTGKTHHIPALNMNIDNVAADTAVDIGIRPEHLSLDENGSGLRVEFIEALGGTAYVHCKASNGETLVVETKGTPNLRPDQAIGVVADRAQIMAFDPSDGRRLS